MTVDKKEYRREYYLDNIDKYKEERKQRYLNNREKENEQ